MSPGEYFGFKAIEEGVNNFACDISVSGDEATLNALAIYDSKGHFLRYDEKYISEEIFDSFVNEFVDYIDRKSGQAVYVEAYPKILNPEQWSNI